MAPRFFPQKSKILEKSNVDHTVVVVLEMFAYIKLFGKSGYWESTRSVIMLLMLLVDLIWGIYADSEGKDIQITKQSKNFSRINMVTTFALPPFGRRALLRAPRCFKPASNSSIFASPALKHNGSKKFAHSFASIESRKKHNLTWSKQVSWPLPAAPSDSALGTSWGHHSVFERHFLCRHATVAPAVSEFQPTQTTSASFVSCVQSGLHTKSCYNSNLQGVGANHPWSLEVRNWICTGNRLRTTPKW